MIHSLTKAFNAYSKTPFNFVWASLLYTILLLVFIFAAVGIFLVYFLLASVLEHPVAIKEPLGIESIPTIAVIVVIVFAFLFFANGLNAALAMAYNSALAKEKTSLAKFYAHALTFAPRAFAVMLVRDFIWLLLGGPLIAIYLYFLKDYAYVDLLVGVYLLFMTFAVHMVFTPALIAAGAFGMSIYGSMKRAMRFLRHRHIFFITLYAIFALAWLLNFVPFINIAMIFFLYPVIYSAIIIMMEGGAKPQKAPTEEEE